MPDQNPKGRGSAGDRGTISLLRRRPRQAVAIAVVLGVAAAAFAYTGGWLTPHRLSPARFVDSLEVNAGGVHHGFRRAHAKGICVAGAFRATPEATACSRAAR